MKLLNVYRKLTATMVALLLLQLTGSAQAEGPGSGGGKNAITVVSAHSRNRVLWDIYSNNQSFADDQPGDQIHINPMFYAEWIDYRTFKSFAYLRSRLELWQNRAPNLIKAINDGLGFSEGKKPPYRLLMIASPLFIQKIDELAIPDGWNEKIKGYPTAYIDDDTGMVFVNDVNWNKAGLISQAGVLLHERLRRLQARFYLTNIELQKDVYMILTQDPDGVSQSDFDDNHFSVSWMTLHTTPTPSLDDIPKLMSDQLQAYFQGGVFDCLTAPRPAECLLQVQKGLGVQSPTAIEPRWALNASPQIEPMQKKKILAAADPGGLDLPMASIGARNSLPPVSATAPFAKFYGVYKITGCHNKIATDKVLDFCTFDTAKILPWTGGTFKDATLITFEKHNADGGVTFATNGPYQAQEVTAAYREDDNSASIKSEFGGSIQVSSEMTVRRDGARFTLIERNVTTPLPEGGHNFDLELTLEPK